MLSPLFSFVGLLKELFQILPTSTPYAPENKSPTKKGTTIILMSGFAGSPRGVTVLRKRFINHGFHVIVLNLDWHSLGNEGLYEMAEELSTQILGVRKDSNLRSNRIFIVAHSAGGLVARYYLQLLGGNQFCDGLITLGTPHFGSWYALLGFVSTLVLKAKILLQMLPTSRFVKSLADNPIPSDCKMVSIYSKGDLLCRRTAARAAKIQQQGIETIEFSHVSHSGYLMSKKVFAQLLEIFSDEKADEPQVSL